MIEFNPTIRSKSMFGGHGLFCEGLMFALIGDGALYFKVDEENEDEFRQLDLPRFTYLRKGEEASLGYRLAPDEVFQHPGMMRPWLQSAWEAAIRADDAKPPSKRKRVKG